MTLRFHDDDATVAAIRVQHQLRRPAAIIILCRALRHGNPDLRASRAAVYRVLRDGLQRWGDVGPPSHPLDGHYLPDARALLDRFPEWETAEWEAPEGEAPNGGPERGARSGARSGGRSGGRKGSPRENGAVPVTHG